MREGNGVFVGSHYQGCYNHECTLYTDAIDAQLGVSRACREKAKKADVADWAMLSRFTKESFSLRHNARDLREDLSGVCRAY